MNGFFPIDLHMHSSYSDDGQFTPSELAQLCIDAGLSIIAITDHNTVKGSREFFDIKAVIEGNDRRLVCYPAIEVDCTYRNVNLHVLGYEIDLTRPDFDEIEQNIRKQTVHASYERLRLIKKLGFDLAETDLNRITSGTQWVESWTGEVFAEALLHDERYLDSEILRPYRVGGARSDNPYVNFYWDYCGPGKHCYVEMTYPDLRDVLEILHKSGGKAVLAHPGQSLKEDLGFIDALVPLGLDGIEVYSSYHPPELSQLLLNKANEHGLMVTRGSDFHGKTKPSVKLGYCGIDMCWEG